MRIDQTFANSLKNAYDIRHTNLTNENAYEIGRAFGSELIEQGKKNIVISYDRRRNSKQLHDNFINGAIATGINITSIGCVATPVVQTAEFLLNTDACVSITASHNGAHFHGLKLFVNKHAFSSENLQKLFQRIIVKNFATGKGKLTEQPNFIHEYVAEINKLFQFKGTFKIGWDLVNASAADSIPFINLKGENYIINHEKDCTFGNHPPDGSYEPRLESLKKLIAEKKLDFAFAFDGDADRCIVINCNGVLIPGDTILAIFIYFMKKETNADIKTVWDSKSSAALIKWAKKFSECHISSTGHSNVYNLLRKIDADIAGECSGHYMFKEFFGINDGIFTAMKLISLLEKNNTTLAKAIQLLPSVWKSTSYNIPCLEENKEEALKHVKNILLKQGVTIDEADGVKACYSSGWWQVRASQTEPVLRVAAEGWNEEGLDEVVDALNVVLSAVEIN